MMTSNVTRSVKCGHCLKPITRGGGVSGQMWFRNRYFHPVCLRKHQEQTALSDALYKLANQVIDMIPPDMPMRWQIGNELFAIQLNGKLSYARRAEIYHAIIAGIPGTEMSYSAIHDLLIKSQGG